MERSIILLIAMATYTALAYIAIRDVKAILIGLLEFAGLLVILALVNLIGQQFFQGDLSTGVLSIIAVVIGVILKIWLKPMYRIPGGFAYLDKPFRKAVFPKADIIQDTLILYDAKQAKRPQPQKALQLPLKGPLKRRNQALIEQLYHLEATPQK